MLVYTEERLYPKTTNTMVLEIDKQKEDSEFKDFTGYLMVSKDTYDAAVKMSVRYDFADIIELLSIPEASEELVVDLAQLLPEPLHLMAPFVGIIGIEDKLTPENVVDFLGAIHVISNQLDMYGFLKMDRSLRELYKPTATILKEYADSWKAVKLQCVKEDLVQYGVPFIMQQGYAQPNAPVYSPAQTPQAQPVASSSGDVLPDVLEAEDLENVTMEDFKNSPNWERNGMMWVNSVSGQSLFFDDSDEEDEYETSLPTLEESVEEEEEIAQPSTEALTPAQKLKLMREGKLNE